LFFLSQADARPWLCVFDNADDLSVWIRRLESELESDSWKAYLPKSKTAVKLASPNIIEVPEMDEASAVQLL